MNVNHFTKKILFWRWKVTLALVLHKFNCLLHSHLNLIEQLSWRQIQIDQSEAPHVMLWVVENDLEQLFRLMKIEAGFV